MANSWDPDQARRFVGPDLGPNCLSRLSADDTGRQRVKEDYLPSLLASKAFRYRVCFFFFFFSFLFYIRNASSCLIQNTMRCKRNTDTVIRAV